MVMYLGTGKYTSEALAGVRQAGYVSRRTASEQTVESLGGRLESMYFTRSNQWDLIVVMTLPDSDAAFAFQSFGQSRGVFERMELFELRTPEEADAAVKVQAAWFPPGQSG